MDTHKILRTLKLKSPKDYLPAVQNGQQISSIKIIDSLSFEFMLNSLRLIGGFNPKLFESRTGQSIKLLNSQMREAENLGLLDVGSRWIKPTKKGCSFLNELQEIFL